MPPGVSAPRSNSKPPSAKLMEKLGAVEVEELDGSRVTFGAIWEASPAALVFLRHYG